MADLTSVTQIAQSLSVPQQHYMARFYLGRTLENMMHGSPRGLVKRGLLAYAWGFDSSMGYKETQLGREVAAVLARIGGSNA